MAQPKKTGLGKGLDALFGGVSINEQPQETVVEEKSEINDNLKSLKITEVEPNRDQPRKQFKQEALEDLAESIKTYGIIQPIVVTKQDGYYGIVAGERRWRAARIAGLEKIPAIEKDLDELKILEAALIENVQREDLNPMEEAYTYKRLSEEYSLSQEQIAKKVGKSRTVVANAIRLLNLDERVQTFIKENRISNGHGRALIPLDKEQQFELAERIIDEGLSVRQIEELVKEIQNPQPEEEKKTEKTIAPNPELARACVEIAKDLKSIFGTKVTIKNGKKKGKIEIEYYSPDELDRIVGLMKKNM